MFGEVPALGLIFGTFFCEFFVSLGAALAVGASRGNVDADGLIFGLLSCAAAFACGVVAWRAAARMNGKWAGGILAAATSLVWVLVLQSKGGFGS